MSAPDCFRGWRGREFEVYYDRRDVGVLYLFVGGEYVGEAYCPQLMGGRVSEWEARAMRKHDETEAKPHANKGERSVPAFRGSGVHTPSPKRRDSTSEQSRQWDRQREDIHPAEVLERLASVETKKRPRQYCRLPSQMPTLIVQFAHYVFALLREEPFMTHPLFRKDIFVETAFESRFQAMLRSARHKRSWHVIVADPGSGKTMGIREMVKTAGSPAILAVTAPKNNDDEQALGDQLFAALGLKLTGHWRTRKPKLMGHLHQFGTELLIVDDAHDLSLEHLMFIKEITDQGRLQYDHPLGLCLVAAGRGNTIPLKEIFDQPDPMWLQFRRRLDKLEPFCRIAGHTSEEVREILAALETVYRELFPQLNLRQWSGSIYTWLTQPVLTQRTLVV